MTQCQLSHCFFFSLLRTATPKISSAGNDLRSTSYIQDIEATLDYANLKKYANSISFTQTMEASHIKFLLEPSSP